MNTRRLLLASMLFLPVAVQAQPEQFVEGTHYELLRTPVRTANPGKIEVLEYFFYGCPACYQFDPRLSSWASSIPDDVQMVRMPALWDDLKVVHAKAFYAAESLGVTEDLHSDFFASLHLLGKRLDDREELQEFFAGHGVAAEDFNKAFDSFSVNSSINRARDQANKYGSQVRATPTLVVNGKYVVSGRPEMLEIVDFLIEKERNDPG